MKQLLETMCGGDFLSKNLEEAMDFLNYVAETSKAWDEPNPREVERMKPVTSSRGACTPSRRHGSESKIVNLD